MKTLLKIGIASLVLSSTLACAAESDFDNNSRSLIGIEGGYSAYSTQPGFANDGNNFGQLGVKIGAQTDSYRVFISGRTYDISGMKSANSLGAEAQYLLNISKGFNAFGGLNGGMMYLNYRAADVSTQEYYYGADLGVNIHVIPEMDFEVGARYMHLGNDDKVTGAINHIETLYASLIYKFKMD